MPLENGEDLERLLSEGASPNAKNEEGESALIVAVREGPGPEVRAAGDLRGVAS